jgi:hypothetical protein
MGFLPHDKIHHVTSSDDAHEEPHIHVLIGSMYDRVRGGTPEAKEWLEANVPEDDVLEPDEELDGLVVVDFEPLIEKAEAAGITVYRWNERGLAFDEDEDEDEDKVDDADEEFAEEPESERPPTRSPWPPGRGPISPQDVIGDEDEG